MNTIALIGNRETNSVMVYYQSIKESIIEKGGNPDHLNCILHSCKFLESEAEEDEEDDWNINSSKLCEACMSTASWAKKLVFCNPMLHLLLNTKFTERLVIDLVASVTTELQKKSLKRIVTLGVHKKLDKEYFSGLIKKGFELFSFQQTYDSAKNDKERISLIKKLAGVDIQGVLVYNRPDVEELTKKHEAPLPILFTHKIHAMAVADFCLSDSKY